MDCEANVLETSNSFETEQYSKNGLHSPHNIGSFQTSSISCDNSLFDKFHSQVPGSADPIPGEGKDCVIVKTEQDLDVVEVIGVELGTHQYGGEHIGGQFSSDSNQTEVSQDGTGKL